MSVMFVLKSSERWRVYRASFSSFVCKSVFSGVRHTLFTFTFNQCWKSEICDQFIETDIQWKVIKYTNCFDNCFIRFLHYRLEDSAAKSGLNDIPGLFTNSTQTLQVNFSNDKGKHSVKLNLSRGYERFSAFRLLVKFYCISNLVTWMCLCFVVNGNVLFVVFSLQLLCAKYVVHRDKITCSVICIPKRNSSSWEECYFTQSQGQK
jgi:hypothetical protein